MPRLFVYIRSEIRTKIVESHNTYILFFLSADRYYKDIPDDHYAMQNRRRGFMIFKSGHNDKLNVSVQVTLLFVTSRSFLSFLNYLLLKIVAFHISGF